MSLSVARVPTVSASRYLQQLAKHWSHKMTVVFTPEEGTIAFPNGTSLAMRADSESLDLELTVPDGEDTGRMREVEIGRASCRDEWVSTCRSRWAPYH